MKCKYPRVRELRIAGKFTQKQVCEYINYSIQSYSSYECGHFNMPSYVLIKLAEFHHTSVDYLLGLTDVRQPYPAKKDAKNSRRHSSMRQPDRHTDAGIKKGETTE